jgi:hypothetical protein
MMRATCLGALLATSLLVAGVSSAEELELGWSSTLELRLKNLSSPANDDDTTGFFDRYEFTRNKNEEPTVDIGLREFDLDLLGNRDTPRLQFRLRSPSSNFNLSGGNLTLGEYFLNQRGKLYARPRGLAFNLDYRRSRHRPSPRSRSEQPSKSGRAAARYARGPSPSTRSRPS